MAFFNQKPRKKKVLGNKTNIQPLVTDEKTVQDQAFKHSSTNNVIHTITPKTVFQPLVDKKLTIILIENTTKVAKESNIFLTDVKKLVPSGLVSIINYGSTVRQSEIVEVETFDKSIFLYDDIRDDACLYDALVDLESLVSREYMHIDEKKRIRVSNIEIIGIGTCTDTCSKSSKEVGIDCFCKVASKFKVVTKCFCLTEENFIDAAEIGFHSIGAIIRNY